MITSLALIICGILATSSIIIKNKPEAKELIDKIVPFQGWIGIIIGIWGIWGIIYSIMNIRWLSIIPGYWITYLVTAVVELGLGILLGYALFSKLALKNKPELREKGEEMVKKLANIQIPLGVAGIIIGIWSLISNFIWYFSII